MFEIGTPQRHLSKLEHPRFLHVSPLEHVKVVVALDETQRVVQVVYEVEVMRVFGNIEGGLLNKFTAPDCSGSEEKLPERDALVLELLRVRGVVF